MTYNDLAQDAALIVVDMQEDFCEPHGALAVKGGRELAQGINRMLDLPFKLKLGTQDYHPPDHCSFASQHEGTQAFTSTHTIKNPKALESQAEEQTTLLWPDHCVRNTKGAELIQELHATKLSTIVRKGEDARVESYSAFGPPFRKPAIAMSDLQKTLEQHKIRRVFVCGLAIDFCVKYTALDAAEANFDTYIIEDLTKAVNDADLDAVRNEIGNAGVRLIRADSLGA